MRSVIPFAVLAVAAACSSSPRATPRGGTPTPATSAPRDTARDTARDTTPGDGGSSAAALAGRRESLRATVGAAELQLSYGRPSMQGRKVFGALVPFGQVWRLGADAATSLTTTKDLVVGGYDVPAGSYTLYAIPVQTVSSPCGASTTTAVTGQAWSLVVNRQTGQAGTEYDEKQDLVRIPMRVSTLGAPIEQLSIAVLPKDETTGTLSVTWETTKAEVGFRVK
jgi:hypothetical protein